jgi:hypothetical protein
VSEGGREGVREGGRCMYIIKYSFEGGAKLERPDSGLPRMPSSVEQNAGQFSWHSAKSAPRMLSNLKTYIVSIDT